MTQTLIDPPTIKYLLPAQIKHHGKDHLVVVRSRSIEIQEVVRNEDFEFRSIHAKVKMQSPIRSARVFGPIEDPSDVLESKDDIKIELEEDEQNKPFRLAPHFVALALESKKLCFLSFATNHIGKVKILQSFKELYSGSSYQEQLGEHIAVDPRSRALAVAAHENLFSFMALKTRQALVDEPQACQNITPIREEVMIPVDGIVIKMEFLYPPATDAQNTILLLLVHKHEKTRLLCYEWDSLSPSVRTIRQIDSGQTLPYEARYPLLLIPFRFGSAFMIVCESEFSVYRDILSGSATFSRQALDYSERPEEAGLSTKFPVFTQWARPKRSPSHVLHQDDIYLCREDGFIRFLEVKDSASGYMVDTQSQVGRLKVNVNTAFAALSLDLENDYSGDDYIAAGGDMSNGGLWEFKARGVPEHKSTIPNWTPMSDLVVLRNRSNSHNMPLTKNNVGFRGDRIFAGTGRGSLHGSITEVRHGIKASCASSIQIPDSGPTPLEMWVLNDEGDQERRLVFISYPTSTSIFSLQTDNSQIPDIQGFKLDVSTLVVGALSGGIIAQVTEHSILLVSTQNSASTEIKNSPVVHYVAASFFDCNGDTLLVTAARHSDDTIVSVRHALHDALGPPGLREYIPATRFSDLQVTCIILHKLDSHLMVVLATSDCHLRVFKVHAGLHDVVDHDFSQDPGGDFTSICDSIAIIDDHNACQWALCGLRNGFISALLLMGGDKWVLTRKETFSVGTTSIKTYTGGNDFVLLLCEDTMYYLDFYNGAGTLSVIRLYLDREDHSSLSPDFVNAIAKSPPTSVESSSSWLCIQQDQLLQFDILSAARPTMVPRQILTQGSPKHLLYCERLKVFVAVLTKPLVDESQHPWVRRLQHWIWLYRERREAQEEPSLIDLKPGETTLGIMEWFPQSDPDAHAYHLLVLHTTISYGPGRTPSGRILISPASPQGQIRFKQARAFDSAVTSVTPYDSNTMLYCEAHKIGVLCLEPSQEGERARFSVLREINLASRASQISTELRGPHQRYVYVSTEQNSIQVIADNGTTFSLLCSDSQRRTGLCHLKIPEMDLILSASTNKLHGSWLSGKTRIDGSAPMIFTATLTGSIRDLKLLSRIDNEVTVIGCGIDGAIYRFTIIEEADYDRLSGVQGRFCDRYTSNGPRNGPDVRHVDLDLFAQSFERSKDEGGDALILGHVRKLLMS